MCRGWRRPVRLLDFRKTASFFSDDGIFDGLLRGIIVERDVAGIEKTFEAFPASGHVIDRSAEVVLGTQRGELLIHPSLEFVEQWSRSELALRVTFIVGEFSQFVFDIEQPPEVSHRCRGLCGRAERMQFLELATDQHWVSVPAHGSPRS